MIIVRLRGGLGNQLFQYATAYSIAREKKKDIKLDITFFQKDKLRKFRLDLFNIEYKEKYNEDEKINRINIFKNRYLNKVLRKLKIRKIFIGKNYIYFLEESRASYIEEVFMLNFKKIYLDGYFQSYMYFEKYRKELLEQFESNVSEKGKEYETEINKVEAVAVHIRRGDFLKMNRQKNTYNYILGLEYYFKAMNIIEKSVKNPVYYFFSDDINWVKEKFEIKEQYKYISLDGANADVEELMLMKKCKHIIAANSTFSWWAAWLNENENAVKIVPMRAFGNRDMIPNTWIRLEYEC